MKKELKEILLGIIIRLERIDYGKDFNDSKGKTVLSYNELRKKVKDLK